MKLLIPLLAFINGAWMIFDGVHVLIHGKYFGPELPGPWARIFEAIDIDPFSLGPLFILMGIAWLILCGLTLFQKPNIKNVGLGISFFSIWYFPFGTIISLICLGYFALYKGVVKKVNFK